MQVERRDFRAVAVALVLLFVGLGGTVGALLVVHTVHRHDVEALHRDPSYRFGTSISPYQALNLKQAQKRCNARIAAGHPNIVSFSDDKALEGCLDYWKASTEL